MAARTGRDDACARIERQPSACKRGDRATSIAVTVRDDRTGDVDATRVREELDIVRMDRIRARDENVAAARTQAAQLAYAAGFECAVQRGERIEATNVENEL